MLVVDNFHVKIRYTYTHFVNEKKKYISNTKYTIQHRIERSQTIKHRRNVVPTIPRDVVLNGEKVEIVHATRNLGIIFNSNLIT